MTVLTTTAACSTFVVRCFSVLKLLPALKDSTVASFCTYIYEAQLTPKSKKTEDRVCPAHSLATPAYHALRLNVGTMQLFPA